MSDIIENASSLKDGVSDAVDTSNSVVETINNVSNLATYAEIYNAEDSSEEEKTYASIMIMNTFFSFGDAVPDICGGALLDVNSAEYVTDAINIYSKSVFKRKLYEEGLAADDAGDAERAQICQEMCNNLDSSYEAMKIAIEERIKQKFPTSKTEWDKFYESYQECNDPDEIYNNVTGAINDCMTEITDELGLMDETTIQGQWVRNAYEAIVNIGNKAKYNWDFWEGYGAYLYDEVHKEDNCWRDAISSLWDNIVDAVVGKNRSKVNTASNTVYDPIILDLNGDGFNIDKKEDGVHFDLDKNGFAEKINWTSKDGFLCLDLNGNGAIDDGGELFGDKTLLADGTTAKNGFEALVQYDSNSDGNGKTA